MIWTWSAEPPLEIELSISSALEKLFPDAKILYINIFSFHPNILGDRDGDRHAIWLSNSVAFALRAEKDASMRAMSQRLFYDGQRQGSPLIQVSSDTVKLGEQCLLIVARPIAADEKVIPATEALSIEVGYLVSVFGNAIIFPQIFSGAFLQTHQAFGVYQVGVEKRYSAAEASVFFSALSGRQIDIGLLDEKHKKALRLVALAKNSRDAVSRWVYLRSAVEQVLGKRSQDSARVFYRSNKILATLAWDFLKKLKDHRDSVLHDGELERLTALEERIAQSIVFDALNFPDGIKDVSETAFYNVARLGGLIQENELLGRK